MTIDYLHCSLKRIVRNRLRISNKVELDSVKLLYRFYEFSPDYIRERYVFPHYTESQMRIMSATHIFILFEEHLWFWDGPVAYD